LHMVMPRASFPTREDTLVATPAKTITCPDCGLVLRVTRSRDATKLIYDVKDWKLRCDRPGLGDPAWCLVRHSTKPGKNEN
jgi:hypothetical protein